VFSETELQCSELSGTQEKRTKGFYTLSLSYPETTLKLLVYRPGEKISEKAQEGADQAQQGTEPEKENVEQPQQDAEQEKGNASKEQQEGSNVEHAV
jgi:hypothetical protein